MRVLQSRHLFRPHDNIFVGVAIDKCFDLFFFGGFFHLVHAQRMNLRSEFSVASDTFLQLLLLC
jgi:hypothetical protein